MARRFRVIQILSGVFLMCGVTHAQDHEKCYKIKDPLKLSGNVDLNSAQFGLEAGCIVSSAKYFCVPASKTVNSATNKTTGLPIAPLPVYSAPAPGDRICYKIKCPAAPIVDQVVTDQFGTRTYPGVKFKASFMCTPAVKGAGFCGNGVIDPGEACDFPALGACTVGCQPDCTCTCPTACCYREQVAGLPETDCTEYVGTPAQVATFTATCNAMISIPAAPPWIHTGVAGPCFFGPTFGLPCIPGANYFPGSIIDSTCP